MKCSLRRLAVLLAMVAVVAPAAGQGTVNRDGTGGTGVISVPPPADATVNINIAADGVVRSNVPATPAVTHNSAAGTLTNLGLIENVGGVAYSATNATNVVNLGRIIGNITFTNNFDNTITLGNGSTTTGTITGGGGTNIINLDGAGTWTGSTNGTFAQLNKTGAGTFTLNGPGIGVISTTINGGGTLFLNDGVTYSTANLTANGSTLQVGGGGAGATVSTAEGSGPATFTSGASFIVNANSRFTAGTLTMSGNSRGTVNGFTNATTALSMTDSRIDVGTNGRLTLTGATTNLQNSTINVATGGTLQGNISYTNSTVTVNGTLNGNPTVGSGSTLNGSGTINGNVIIGSGGTLSPGNSPGTISVTGDGAGNMTLQAGSRSLFELTNTTFDVVNATGTITLGGTLAVAALEPIRTSRSFRILNAGAGITGAFSAFDLSAINSAVVSLTLQQSANALDVLFRRVAYEQLARSDNQRAVGRNLDLYLLGADTGLNSLTLALDSLATATQVGDALDRISPEVLDAQVQLPIIHAQQHAGQMEQYLAGVRLNMARRRAAQPVAKNGPASAGPAGRVAAGAPVAASGAIAQPVGSAPGAINHQYYDPNKRDGGFLTGYSHQIDQNTILDGTGSLRLSGFDSGSTGVLAGADRRMSDNFTVGIAIGAGDVRSDFAQGRGTIRGDQFQIGPYATWAHEDYYVDALLTYNAYDYRTRRAVAFTGFGENLNSSTDADSFSGYIGGGWRKRSGPWNWGPTLSLQYTSLDVDPFTETGGVSALRVGGRDTDSLRSQLGVRVSREYSSRPDRVVIPELRARWAHEFANDDTAINGQFVGATLPGFTVRAARPDRDSAYVGGSVNAFFDQKYNAFVSYDADLGKRGQTTDSVRGGVGIKF